MIRITLAMVVFIFISYDLMSQTMSIVVSTNYSSYSLKDSKNLTDELFENVVNQIGLPFEVTDNFPSFFSYQLDANIDMPNMKYGLQFTNRTTGARISYSDYSGKYNIDQYLEAYELKVKAGTYLINKNKLNLLFMTKLGIALSSYTLSSDFELYSSNLDNKETLEFSALNTILGGELDVNIFVYKNIFIAPSFGYDYHITGKVAYIENKDYILINNSGKEVKVNWSGLRVGIGIGIKFLSLERNER